MSKKLYLIPNFLSEESTQDILPNYIVPLVSTLRFFLVEEEKSARRLLKKLKPDFPLNESVLLPLNEHVETLKIKEYFKEAKDQDIGIITEAGSPCIADPGKDAVIFAHENNWEVFPLIGPCSITLALMASGLNGQNFAFCGYLPREKEQRIKRIKELERRSFVENQTQIFMETPYRNKVLLEDILNSCDNETLLCIAWDLTSKSQWIKTSRIKYWRKENLILQKNPALFMILKEK